MNDSGYVERGGMEGKRIDYGRVCVQHLLCELLASAIRHVAAPILN